ncbi:MAG: esterase-like activity of phytase family protein [Desulfofustis sp.]|nr:esterase-like activity of phytase family protein [Desulfofustis sp.]NNK56014.1 esterase-like activity of phytase family protein [Desulfofustis sp.]
MKVLLTLSLTTLVICLTPNPAAAATLQLLGDINFEAGIIIDETRFNGLSGIAYDEDQDLYYIISDDRAEYDHARLYLTEIDIGETVQVSPRKVLFLKDQNNQPFASHTVDFEGIILLPNNNLLISSEGAESRGINSSLFEFTRDGTFIREWLLPSIFDVGTYEHHGIRNNLGLESLTITPDKEFIFTANEQALKQDGPVATIINGSPVRIVKFNRHGQALAHYFYMVDSLPNPTGRKSLKGDNGLVELIALNEWQLLALERSYLPELRRNVIRLYRVDLSTARDVSSLDSLLRSASEVNFAKKELVFDFDSIVPLLSDNHRSLDNLEGVSFGPLLGDGSHTLVLVSDGNFNKKQRTQFLVLKIVP